MSTSSLSITSRYPDKRRTGQLSIFLLCLGASSSSSSVGESSSPGVPGRELVVALSSWPPSYRLLPPLLGQGLGAPGGWRLLLAAWAGRWFTGGVSTSFSISSAASLCPDRTCILPERVAIDSIWASRFWETASSLFRSTLFFIHSCLFFIACTPRSLCWGHCNSCPSSLLSFVRSISHNAKS